MPFDTTVNSFTRTLFIPAIVQSEDDGSIAGANWTGLSAGVAGLVQANGFIGDGPFGTTTGDHDGFRVEVAAGWSLIVDVDSDAFGTHNGAYFDPYLQVYDSAGLQAIYDDDDGRDSYCSFYNGGSVTESFTIFLSDLSHQVVDPNDSGSGNGSIVAALDTGYYRILFNTFDPNNSFQGRILVG